MKKQFTVITPRTVLRVAATSQQQIEKAAKDIGLTVLGISEDRPPKRTAVSSAFEDLAGYKSTNFGR